MLRTLRLNRGSEVEDLINTGSELNSFVAVYEKDCFLYSVLGLAKYSWCMETDLVEYGLARCGKTRLRYSGARPFRILYINTF